MLQAHAIQGDLDGFLVSFSNPDALMSSTGKQGWIGECSSEYSQDRVLGRLRCRPEEAQGA